MPLRKTTKHVNITTLFLEKYVRLRINLNKVLFTFILTNSKLLMSRTYISIITDALSFIATKVELHNHLNLQDLNVLLENVFRDILNVIYSDRNFINLNSLESNFTAIDLGDNINDISIQVTSTSKLGKVRSTITKYKEEYGYNKVIMLYAKMKKPKRSVDINAEFDNIQVEEWSLKDLCKKIEDLTDEEIRHIQRIIINQVNPALYDNYSKVVDESGSENWDNLENKDVRNFSDKILAVCPKINKARIIKYSRDIASGEAELSKFSQRDISAMKYRIFEVCQDELLEFCEKNDTSNDIDLNTLTDLIEKYTERACEIIMEKSKDYSYPLKNKDILKKIVLALINDCYLSFDEKGIYS